jgi:hypothetical protein
MSIPLDRLYHYIENIAEEIYGSPIIIYRFYPHGSKKLENLASTKNFKWYELRLNLGIYCNDQEPLDYNYYHRYILNDQSAWAALLKSCSVPASTPNLKTCPNIYDRGLLLHSEQRSMNLYIYQKNNWITIYYWCHALLARDWFRYAEYIDIDRKPVKTFLIYNRAWADTREYRLKFADLLIDHNLVDDCQTSVGFVDQDIYYKNYKFTNSQWQPLHHLEQYFQNNLTSSTSSADFTVEDYCATDIEVVLETLFDDKRLHLTEKSLRPIACGHPFILAATHGSLQYLRNYGFRTFGDIIDESYDLIENPLDRLKAIVLAMKQITNWTKEEKQYKMRLLQEITEYNKQHFFSMDFFNQILNELKENLTTAFTLFDSIKSSNQWVNRWNEYLSHQSVIDFLKNSKEPLPTKTQVDLVYREAKKYIK